MKSFGLLLLVAGLALAATPAHAADAGKTSFVLKGHSDGGQNFWTEGDGTTRNPTLDVPAGATITLTVSSVAGTHEMKVGDKEASAPLNEGDPAVTYTFTAPASGNVQYICPFHMGDMKGNFHVAGSSTEEPKKSPGTQVVGVFVAMLGAALIVASRRTK